MPPFYDIVELDVLLATCCYYHMWLTQVLHLFTLQFNL